MMKEPNLKKLERMLGAINEELYSLQDTHPDWHYRLHFDDHEDDRHYIYRLAVSHKFKNIILTDEEKS